jgi:hypothetical protein
VTFDNRFDGCPYIFSLPKIFSPKIGGGDCQMQQHLRELLRPTPLGRTKLIAAWDGLDVPTQLEILAELASSRERTSRDRAFWEKALASHSEYIRYVAARDANLDERDPNDLRLLERIAADPSALMKNSRAHAFYPEPDQFSAFPLEKKLALVGGDDLPDGNVSRGGPNLASITKTRARKNW